MLIDRGTPIRTFRHGAALSFETTQDPIAMNERPMKTVALITGTLSAVSALAVFIFADGAVQWYSGLFFVVLAVVSFTNAYRWRHGPPD